jgi:hypothetical protein
MIWWKSAEGDLDNINKMIKINLIGISIMIYLNNINKMIKILIWLAHPFILIITIAISIVAFPTFSHVSVDGSQVPVQEEPEQIWGGQPQGELKWMNRVILNRVIRYNKKYLKQINDNGTLDSLIQNLKTYHKPHKDIHWKMIIARKRAYQKAWHKRGQQQVGLAPLECGHNLACRLARVQARQLARVRLPDWVAPLIQRTRAQRGVHVAGAHRQNVQLGPVLGPQAIEEGLEEAGSRRNTFWQICHPPLSLIKY